MTSGKFSAGTRETDITRLESQVSFLQIMATMSLQERIRQVKAEISDNRRQIKHVWLEREGIPGDPEWSNSVCHKLSRVEVVPRQHTECTNEIPVIYNLTEVFVTFCL